MTRGFLFTLTAFVLLASPTSAQWANSDSALSSTHKSYVEKLTGSVAKRHLDNLAARRPVAFRRASEVLRQRGWSDTGKVEVVRTNQSVAFHGANPLRPEFRQIQNGPSAYGAQGEIVTWQWDDGNYDTWEGTLYLHEYTTGVWMIVDCQVWMTANSEWQIIWDYVVDGDDDPSRGPDDQIPAKDNYRNRERPVLVATVEPASVLNGIGAYQLAAVDWSGVRRAWGRWALCSASGCGGAVVACNLQNPTPQEKPDVLICAAGWCVGAGVACLPQLSPDSP